MSEEVNIFPFNDQRLDALEASLSTDRMRTYVKATAGDRELALRLYIRNTAVSAAFYGPLQGLEVALRNAMHRELTIKYREDWYDNPDCGLDNGSSNRIEKAKSRLSRGNHAIDPPHIVAALPFGFWASLLGRGGRAKPPETGKKNYEMTLWRPALYKAFPHSRRNRADTHKPLESLRILRNRIAHHEPIFGRHLKQDYHSILEVLEWICPETRAWIEHHSRIDELLARDWKDGGIAF